MATQEYHQRTLTATTIAVTPIYSKLIDIDTNCIAVNAVFIDHICALSEFSEDEPRIKRSHKELQEQDHTELKIMNSLFELYQEKGLYIIGINTHEKA
ncbi:MAG: hypothetical protein OXM61_16085 [Candidatus Poribacteria bacterium]|nr:hypothetical protein [Candidatus Poribacteria bacterium]